MPPVSLTMIVRNERENLPACLQTVAGLFDETIVVDTGSTDDTREIARSFGAKVFDFQWCDDFSAALNESLRQASGEWFFRMDADDRLDEANRPKLRALLTGLDEPKVYDFAIAHVRQDGSMLSAEKRPLLFHRSLDLRWILPVYEFPYPIKDADLVWSGVAITHLGHPTPEATDAKNQRNLQMLQRAIERSPNDPLLYFSLGKTLLKVGRADEGAAVFELGLTTLTSAHDSFVGLREKMEARLAAARLLMAAGGSIVA